MDHVAVELSKGDKMIRQRTKAWRDQLATLSTQDRDNLLRGLRLQQDTYENACKALSTRYKAGEITLTEMDSLGKAELTKFETWALTNGYYENVTSAQLASEAINGIINLFDDQPDANMLMVITNVVNKRRQLIGKALLTVDQVKTRLMT